MNKNNEKKIIKKFNEKKSFFGGVVLSHIVCNKGQNFHIK